MKNAILLSLSAVLLFTACKKGGKGDAGTAGANGANGNAGVKSDILTASGSDWQWDDVQKTSFIQLADSAIDTAIYDSGSVQVFQQTGFAAWLALPYSFVPAGAPYTLSWYYMYSAGGIVIYAQASDHTHVNFSASTNYFKVVCIASAAHKAHPNVNWTDHNQVMAVQKSQFR